MHARRPGPGASSLLGLATAGIVVLLASTPARAADTDEQRAEALFREGRAAVERGDDAGGCPKFAESLRILPRAGATVNLAQCEERRGKLVSALDLWRKGVGLLAGDADRLKLARERVASLEQRVPRLTIKLDLEKDSPWSASVVVDGVAVEAATAETPRPLDPGSHTLVISAPGRATFRTTVTLAEGQQSQVLAVLPRTGPTGPVDQPASGGGLRTAGFVVTGVGAASLVVGAVTGGLTISKKNAVNANCTPTCNDAARSAATAGKTLSAVSTATFIVGAAGIAGGVVMIVLGKPRPPPAVALSAAVLPGGSAMMLTGRF